MSFWNTIRPGTMAGTMKAGPAAAPGEDDLTSDPVRWAQSRLDFTCDPLQAEILRSVAARLILCCTRQFGKSTITAIKALHHAWSHPNSLVLAAAPTARQSGEWLEKTRFFLSQLGIRGRSDGHNRLSIVLPNGSRLVGLPGVADNVRGFSKASLILIDEAAFVPDELYQALNPMLAVSRGGLWLISTPAAQSGFFFEEWSRDTVPNGVDAAWKESPNDGSHGPPGPEISSPILPDSPISWERFRATAEQCSRIPPDFLAEQRILLGDPVFRREYMCEFVAAGAQIIDRDLLDSALDPEVCPFNGGSPLWR